MIRTLTFLASVASMQADAHRVIYYVNELAGCALSRTAAGRN